MKLHSSTRQMAAKILKLSHLPYICFYCGQPADNREHVFPKCVYGEQTPKVWSCGECNQLAGSEVFASAEEKRDYVKLKLRMKYKKFFEFPDWDEEEIGELRGRLKDDVKAMMAAKKVVRSRISWEIPISTLLMVKIIKKTKITIQDMEFDLSNPYELRRLISDPDDDYPPLLA